MNDQVWLYSSHILFSKSRRWTVSRTWVEERERGTFGWAPRLALLPAPCVTPCVLTLGCAHTLNLRDVVGSTRVCGCGPGGLEGPHLLRLGGLGRVLSSFCRVPGTQSSPHVDSPRL